MIGHGLVGVRVRGLWAGSTSTRPSAPAVEICEALMARGVLAKDTHGSTIRLAPPLVIDEADLVWGLDQLEAVLAERPALTTLTRSTSTPGQCVSRAAADQRRQRRR